MPSQTFWQAQVLVGHRVPPRATLPLDRGPEAAPEDRWYDPARRVPPMTTPACRRADAPVSARRGGRLAPTAVALAMVALAASQASALDFAVGAEGGYVGMSNAS